LSNTKLRQPITLPIEEWINPGVLAAKLFFQFPELAPPRLPPAALLTALKLERWDEILPWEFFVQSTLGADFRLP
jgi:hypothetical protein